MAKVTREQAIKSAERVLGYMRYLAMAAIIPIFVGAIVMMWVGIRKMGGAVWHMIEGTKPLHVDRDLSQLDFVTTQILASLDSFLFALILIYLSYAIYFLFIEKESAMVRKIFPESLIPSGLGELKETLGTIVVIILFVLFLQMAWSALDDLAEKTWELLIIPGSIALLALALKLMNLKGTGTK